MPVHFCMHCPGCGGCPLCSCRCPPRQSYLDNFFKLPTEEKMTDLEEENKRLSELLWGSRCVYCGETLGLDKKNQDIADEVLQKHIEQCSLHPVSTLKTENKQLQKDIEHLKSSLPFYSGRDENKAREVLGDVMRHSTGEGSSIGVVGVNKALRALVSSYADNNALNDECKQLRLFAKKQYCCVGCHDGTDKHTCDWDGFAKMVRELNILDQK